MLTCSDCGSDDLRAWYPEFTSQSIKVELLADGTVTYDYTGSTDTADDAGDDDEYACGGCGRMTETVEELVGKPLPALLGRKLDEWTVLGMLFPGDDPRPDDQFPSGADFIETVCSHFGFTAASFERYIERKKINDELLAKSQARGRLEYLRGELRAERISWGDLHELQSLVEYIDPGDVELLEAAGVPEDEAIQRG